MKQFFTRIMLTVALVTGALSLYGQQFTDPSFEDWSGTQFNNKIQLKNWKASNVEQSTIVGTFRFNFIERESGHTGSYCAKVFDQEVGVQGIATELSPGYLTLGTPWTYISGTNTNTGSGGTDGGINFTYRPDSMSVWIKRTGTYASTEPYSIMFYSWKGTAKASRYQAKAGVGNCSNTGEHTDEESDIRQALDANACGTTQQATQIAEGWLHETRELNQWTNIRIPIYYMNDQVPQKCNVIFAACPYPNFRVSSGLHDGSALYIDDVSLIYSSKIDEIYFDGKKWNGFDPNSSAEQTYSVGRTTVVPTITAKRGVGKITNHKGQSANFPGRTLSGNEINIQYGQVDGAATVITVTAADGSSTTTYRIKMVQAPSDNPRLNAITVNGQPLTGFNGYVGSYNVALPYGTTAAPVVAFTKGEDAQVVTVTQASSPTGTATIAVTAPDGTTRMTYTLNFSVALLDDNTLENILVNGDPVPGFMPSLGTYRVELPLGTTTMPTVVGVSRYPAGEQTITYTAPSVIDGGQYLINVTTPGNQVPKVYKLNFRITASTNSKLQDLQMAGGYISNFNPNTTTYYVTLPMGTTTLPQITYVKGDSYQSVTMVEGGVDGTTTITVTAASGAQTIYKIICSTEKSEISHLNAIYLDGTLLDGFNANTTSYTVNLPLGTTTLPQITWQTADEFEQVQLATGGLNGTTRITVTAGNGNTTIYKIQFVLAQATDATLNMIYVGGAALPEFSSSTYEYSYVLPKGTTTLPAVTWDKHDEWQTVTDRSNGVNGDYKITVRPQSGASATYIIHFSVETSAVNTLNMIYIGGEPIEDFSPAVTEYTDTLEAGVSAIPAVTYELTDPSATHLLIARGNVYTIRVTAEDGSQRIYTLTFVLRKSANAFLKMIYLDGEPLAGFVADELSYDVEIQGGQAPAISVEKDANQQVTILAPVLEGTALVKVTSESGDVNTYTLRFYLKTSEDVMLQAIKLDGVDLATFDGATLTYDLNYDTDIPEVSWVAAEGQTVSKLQEKEEVRLFVTADGNSALYTLRFHKQNSDDASLRSILLDGVEFEGYAADTRDYHINLPAGSSLPVITYQKNHDAQVVFLGQTAENEFAITVTAEDGTTATYTLDFTIAEYTSTQLLGVALDGVDLPFTDGQYIYEQPLAEGASLPVITYTKAAGQTVLSVNVSDREQQLLVIAQNGDMATYRITYNVTLSDDALLSDILIGGVSLEGFAPETFAYTDTLDWRTTVVPNILPVSRTPGQTIVINYSAVNGTTAIHVTAADGVATADYTIAFPVRKSNNVALETVDFEGIVFTFDPEQTDYVIDLPYQTKAAPYMTYEKAEPEQSVKYINAPVTEPSHLIVTAENGDTRDYTFTFNVLASPKPNILDSIIYTYETKITAEPVRIARKVTESEGAITIDLPYATTAFKVGYHKSFDEQTVLVQPGGIYRPTIITVQPNRGDEAAKVYTITPNIAQQDPAVLQSVTIKVGGTPIAFDAFDKNRFTYIVNVTSAPVVTATGENGAFASPIISNDKHYRFNVTKPDGYGNTYENTYDFWFFYPSDVIPNGDFTSWTTAKNNGAPKPTGWNCLADAFTEYSQFASGTHTFGKHGEVTEVTITTGNKGVQLNTKRSNGSSLWGGPLGGYVPAWITLGTVSGNLQIAGGSSFTASGGITFRNTPDVMKVRAKTGAKSNGVNRIVYTLNGMGSGQGVFSTDENTDYKEYSYNLASVNANVTVPSQMNIILNSFQQESSLPLTDGEDAQLTIDYVRFAYSSALTGVKVNGANAAKSGNTFSYTLPSSEDTSLPVLTFIGQVSDQAQLISWEDETAAGVRTATVTNYAEDGTSTSYTVKVTRPLSTINSLGAILINGDTIEGWGAEQLTYTVSIPFGTKNLPSLQAVQNSNLQNVVLTQEGNVVTITVTPESGEAKVYTVTFAEQKSSDVTLDGVAADGMSYNPAQTEYEISAAVLPDITFMKKSDGQKVILDGGVLSITAEDGVTTGTITITAVAPVVTTSGKLSEIAFDGDLIQGFDPDEYAYTKPAPDYSSFVREFAQDSVVMTIAPASLTWQVFGTENHTYTNVYPTSPSSVASLAGILVGGEALEGFLEAEHEYTLKSNTPLELQLLSHDGQTLQVSAAVANAAPARRAKAQRRVATLTIGITAEDATTTDTYTISLEPAYSDDATLQMIRLDDVNLAAFHPDTLNYTVVLPTTNPKLREPQMPSITYMAGNLAQTIELDKASLGETSYLTVTSEDGSNEQTYTLLIEAEPSHNAELTGIMLDGQPIANFSTDRRFYSARVEDLLVDVDYSTEDRFQTITTSLVDNLFTVHVVAQDGVTTGDYQIELYAKTMSSDVTLAQLLLNGQTFTEYRAGLTPYTPMNNVYTINLATDEQVPDVQGMLNSVGQQMDIRQEPTNAGVDVMIDVTAEDGVSTNTYVLHFVYVRSANTDLQMIYIGNDSLSGFTPATHNYVVNLPVGSKRPFPTVSVMEAEVGKQVLTEMAVDSLYTVEVLAEDGVTRANYSVLFHIELSAADTLQMITEDGADMPGFQPKKFYYYKSIPAETRQYPERNRFPNIDWDKAYEGQHVILDTVTYSDYQLTYQVIVVAENGAQNRYTVVYEQERSAIDTLQTIRLNNRDLEGFDPYQTDYTVTLPYNSTDIPAVDCDPGDLYQDTIIARSDSEVRIIAKAENGTERVYTVRFIHAKNNNATLTAIAVGGKDIDPFDPEQPMYEISLPYGTTDVPAITYTKADNNQTVDILRMGNEAYAIMVTAADGVTKQTYALTFTYALSPEAHLTGITIGDAPLEDFAADKSDYQVTLPYGTTELPKVTYTLADTTATATLETNGNSVAISVTSADEEHYMDYQITFIIERCPIDWLTDLQVKGTTVEGFHQDSLIYTITYPVGTDSAAFVHADDITFVKADETETVTIVENNGSISVQVAAENGKNVRVYVLKQIILRSSNSLLADLRLNGATIEGFADSVLVYTYLLIEGEAIPSIEAIPQDSSAEVSVTYGHVNEDTYIYCTAEDRSETVYIVRFVQSTVNPSLAPNKHDVLFKQVKGSDRFVAYSLRNNTKFALYDHNGQMLFNVLLPVCNPNDVTIAYDADGHEIFVDASGEGFEFDIPQHGKMFIYTFFTNEQHLESGKFMIP